jgi:hypothetical protein
VGDAGARGSETGPTGLVARLVAAGIAVDRGAIGKLDMAMAGLLVLGATAGATPPAGPTVMIICGRGCAIGCDAAAAGELGTGAIVAS